MEQHLLSEYAGRGPRNCKKSVGSKWRVCPFSGSKIKKKITLNATYTPKLPNTIAKFIDNNSPIPFFTAQRNTTIMQSF